ncbi:MAG: STAS domain-containing protein [Verrucomicrobia bacterium]|nr:STAS domain-containing protein [Verrucomicrobiota bacterium]
MSNSAPQILVGFNEKVVCLRVRGRGSFLNSGGVKQFAKEMIRRGHREFVVDLAECPMMDSTFMGTLTGIALQLQSLGQGNLHVFRCNERNADLLHGLGLDQILDVADEQPAANAGHEKNGTSIPELDAAANQELPAARADRQATAETMLAAHQALIDADPRNLSRFKDVLDYLKQDLQREGSAD